MYGDLDPDPFFRDGSRNGIRIRMKSLNLAEHL